MGTIVNPENDNSTFIAAVLYYYRNYYPKDVYTTEMEEEVKQQVIDYLTTGQIPADKEVWESIKVVENNIDKIETEPEKTEGNIFSQLFNAFLGGIQALVESLVVKFPEAIKLSAAEMWKGLFDGALGLGEDTWDFVSKAFKNIGMWDDAAIGAMNKLLDKAGPLKFLFVVAMFVLNASQLAGAVAQTSGGDFSKWLMRTFTPNAPSLGEAVRSYFLYPENTAKAEEYIRQNGISKTDQDFIIAASLQQLDVGTAMEAWRREIISDQHFTSILERLGYSTETINIIRGMKYRIIPLQDVLTMVGHEVFEPDMISLYGLADEFPENVVPYAEHNGLSREDMEKYWVSHWSYPSPNQVYDMYHRGVITKKSMDSYFRLIEYSPYWREKSLEISYNLVTRVDARRLYVIGYWDETKLFEHYKHLGYTDDDATGLVLIAINETKGADKELNKTQIQNGYKDGLISETDAIEMLTDLGYDKSTAEYFIIEADNEQGQELVKMQMETIEEKYTENLNSEQETILALQKIGVNDAKIQTLIEQWNVLKIRNSKHPTKDDLEQFAKKGIITKEQFYDQMRVLGYKDTYINWYWSAIAIENTEV